MTFRSKDWVKWDRRFLRHAALYATHSKDPSTQVGAVVVGPHGEIRSGGYNGLPRGLKDTFERLNNRELKLDLVVHAEHNAILNAGLCGVSLDGCILYSTYPICIRCAVAIMQAGIKRVVWPRVEVPEHHKRDLKLDLARKTMFEANIQISTVGADWDIEVPTCCSHCKKSTAEIAHLREIRYKPNAEIGEIEHERHTMAGTLQRAQERCTELLLENRKLKAAVAEHVQNLAKLAGYNNELNDWLQQARRDRADCARATTEGTWIWADTDPNDLESFAEGAVLTMTAGQLRRLLKKS